MYAVRHEDFEEKMISTGKIQRKKSVRHTNHHITTNYIYGL